MKIYIMLFIIFISQKTFAQNGIKIIVNDANPLSKISITQINDFYFKKVRNWPDETPVRFFDRTDGSMEKNLFLKNFLNNSVRGIEQYWIGQKLYSGNSAPSKVSSDMLASSLVSRFPGGISYVSENFPGSKGVKFIEITKD